MKHREQAASQYHIHVYFDSTTREKALDLRARLTNEHDVHFKSLREQAGGPHPKPNWLAVFQAADFGRIVPWLMFHRAGLDILVHPVTDDLIAEHRDHALWLGQPQALDFGHLAHLATTSFSHTA